MTAGVKVDYFFPHQDNLKIDKKNPRGKINLL